MHLFLLGVSHRTAPVELREKLDFSSRDVGAAVEALAARSSAAESVVLSTCNRSEIYVASESLGAARDEIVGFLCDYHQLPPDSFTAHLFSFSEVEVASHLFRVAAGLDSLVVGEPQILGQVKDAFHAAAERRCTGPVLRKLFDWSFNVGKRVRSETALGEGAVSISFAAAQLAKKIFGRLDGRRVLVVGAGEISTLTAQHLRAQGVAEVVITSRTPAHAQALATEVGGHWVPWEGLTGALTSADIIVTATGSQRPIITRAQVETALGRRRRDPLFIIDVAVPRDVEASVSEIEQVFLYNVDDLQTIVQENMSKRAAEIERPLRRLAEVAGCHSDGRGASGSLRDHSPRRVAAPRSEAGWITTGDARTVRSPDPADRGKTAARSHRAAEGPARRGNAGGLYRSGQQALPPSR